MIYTLFLILFFFYSLFVFIINDYFILSIIFIFNLILSIGLKVNLLKHIKTLISSLKFILFIFLCNVIFLDLNESIITSFKLFLVIDLTFIVSSIFNTNNISRGFYYLFYPLKLFKINIDNLVLIISIALAFIPILIDEVSMIKTSLISKGFEFNIKNVLLRPHIFLLTFMNGIFDRINELEKSLMLKAYN